MKHIAILDFGSQYTHLIARTIRELGVLAKIYHHDVSRGELEENAWGIIFSGGPQSVFDGKSLRANSEILQTGLPILGICYGHQFLAHELGGEVKTGEVGEYGMANLEIKGESPIFRGVSDSTQVWMSHGDSVTKLPEGFKAIGETKDCGITAMANENKKIFGFQFHPEVTHSQEGTRMIENFVIDICKAQKEWHIEDVVEELIEKIRFQVGDKKVFILVSGGVDSNVAFALLTKALGEKRVKGLYIDTGFMRKDESSRIIARFDQVGFHNLEVVNAKDKFYEKLRNIYEPEEKRAIIGQTFLDVKDETSFQLDLDIEEWLLGQGTIYPDTIESGGTKNANTIKTHHNRVDAITEMIEKGLIVEPIVDLYKDEVRKVGEILGLPEELVQRHPFPGPGLAIRCLCSDITKNDDEEEKIVEEEIKDFLEKRGEKISCKVLPIKSVGVQGDNRTYAHPLVIWGVDDWERLNVLSSSITNVNKSVNRVILLLNDDIEKKFVLPGECKYLTEDRVDLLREIDDIVSTTMREEKIYSEIDQFPVVLLPICDAEGRESIVLRPINTRDFMTLHFYRMEKVILKKIVNKILATGKIGHIFYDTTNKPPGTTEWE